MTEKEIIHPYNNGITSGKPGNTERLINPQDHLRAIEEEIERLQAKEGSEIVNAGEIIDRVMGENSKLKNLKQDMPVSKILDQLHRMLSQIKGE